MRKAKENVEKHYAVLGVLGFVEVPSKFRSLRNNFRGVLDLPYHLKYLLAIPPTPPTHFIVINKLPKQILNC